MAPPRTPAAAAPAEAVTRATLTTVVAPAVLREAAAGPPVHQTRLVAPRKAQCQIARRPDTALPDVRTQAPQA